jgi:hypothetical protein
VTTKLISYGEALAILETCDEKGVPKPCSLLFCTADRDRGTGGQIITYEKAIWHVKGGRRPEELAPVDGRKRRRSTRKSWTRNIRGFDTDQIRKLHIHLLLTINGLDVR